MYLLTQMNTIFIPAKKKKKKIDLAISSRLLLISKSHFMQDIAL